MREPTGQGLPHDDGGAPAAELREAGLLIETPRPGEGQRDVVDLFLRVRLNEGIPLRRRVLTDPREQSSGNAHAPVRGGDLEADDRLDEAGARTVVGRPVLRDFVRAELPDPEVAHPVVRVAPPDGQIAVIGQIAPDAPVQHHLPGGGAQRVLDRLRSAAAGLRRRDHRADPVRAQIERVAVTGIVGGSVRERAAVEKVQIVPYQFRGQFSDHQLHLRSSFGCVTCVPR